MSDIDTIRALVVGLGYATDPTTVTVALRPYKGAGERSSRRGWRTASVCVNGKPARDGGVACPHSDGRDDDTATTALVGRLRIEVAWAAKQAAGAAENSRAVAARMRREAEEHDAEGQRRDAKAAMLRALLESGR